MNRMLVVVATVSIVAAVSSAHAAEVALLSPGQWREHEKIGLGFGFAVAEGSGTQAYGDYNLSSQYQIHVAVQSTVRGERTGCGCVTLETERSVVTGALRYFPNDATGWYLGGGSGFGHVTQTYSQGGDTTSTAAFVPLFFDGGWEGWDGYYFTVSVQLGIAIQTRRQDKTGNLPSANNHRTTGKRDFDDARSGGASGIMIGFGWYFPAPIARAPEAAPPRR